MNSGVKCTARSKIKTAVATTSTVTTSHGNYRMTVFKAANDLKKQVQDPL